jgi:hypothetical protein
MLISTKERYGEELVVKDDMILRGDMTSGQVEDKGNQ